MNIIVVKFSWGSCNVPNKGCQMIFISILVINFEFPTFSDWVLSMKQSKRIACIVANNLSL